MTAGAKRQLRGLLKEAEKQGWRVEATADGYQLYAPDRANIVTVHLTESDRRAFRNTIARMRRYGFEWKGK